MEDTFLFFFFASRHYKHCSYTPCTQGFSEVLWMVNSSIFQKGFDLERFLKEKPRVVGL